MPFTKNDKNINRSGRKAGSVNKITSEIRHNYLQLIQDNYKTLESDLKCLKSAERVKAIIELSKFILPTLFSAFLGVWYYVFMAELLVLEDVPLHVFTTIARVFYGSLISFPYDAVLTVILSRLIIWVMFFVLTIDMVQLVIILNRFNAFVLSDTMAVLFSAIFDFKHRRVVCAGEFVVATTKFLFLFS